MIHQNQGMRVYSVKQLQLATAMLLLSLCLPLAAAAPPHPLLLAVCQNDYSAAAAQSPQQLDLSAISWGKRSLTALDLALANGYWEIASLLRYSGATVSYRTLNSVCALPPAKTLCAQHAKWRHHPTCRSVQEPARWQKSCRPPELYCKQILQHRQ